MGLLREDIEYVIHSDSKGNIFGPISKAHAHLKGVRETLVHYSTWSMVYLVSEGKYGIQLKNPEKPDSVCAGKWDMGVAGHNCYVKENGIYRPMGFDETLVKEAKEEIGIRLEMCKSKQEFIQKIKLKPKQALGFIFDRFYHETQINKEWVGLGFVIVYDTQLHFEDNEVVDFKWLSPEALRRFLETNENYCSALPLAFEKAESFRRGIAKNLLSPGKSQYQKGAK